MTPMFSHPFSRRPRSSLSVASIFLLSLVPGFATAQQPFGWVSNGHTSAFTLAPGEFELSGTLIRVNDTIDFLNLREELLPGAGNNRLTADSGDLDGTRGELRLGIWQGLEVFYQRQQQNLTAKLPPDSRIDIIDLDESLETTSERYGVKWVFYESANRNRARPWRSAALELSGSKNRSRNFGGLLETIRFSPSVIVQLDPPQRFDLDRLKDDGWNAKLINSHGLGDNTTLSYWAGYGEIDSSSGTSSQIEQTALKEAFLQTFDISENLIYAGASVNWQGIPRLPLQLGYEYIRINSRSQQIQSTNSTLVPSFLRGRNLTSSATDNHTLYGTASWWFTPSLYASISGKVYRNQFVGIIPHYNNPLSSRFSDTVYGYMEMSIGLKFNIWE